MAIKLHTKNIKNFVNKKYYPLLENQSRHLLLYGSAGSGKSHFAAQKLIIRILFAAKYGIKHRFLVLRKTGPAARQSVFTLITRYIYEWGLTELVKINKLEMAFYFWNGSEIHCSGLDDPNKLKSIEGITGVWLEEPTELSYDDYRQIDLRLRGKAKTYKQIIYSFNPISRLVWLHKEFFEKEKRHSTIIHSTYKDNRFLDDEYIETLESLKEEDEQYYTIYTLGQWGILRNLIFNNYEIVPWPPGMVFDDQAYGLDFGFNNPTALVHICYRDGETWTRQVIYERGLTNDLLIDEMKKLIPDRSVPIYADPSEPGAIEEIAQSGFNIQGAENSVGDGLDYCKRTKVHIENGSVDMIKEWQAYKYKEDRDGNVGEKPVKFNDHTPDAFRYGHYTHHLMGGATPRVAIL